MSNLDNQLLTSVGYIGDDIGALQADLSALATRIGQNSNLTTVQKTTIVEAINENKSRLDTLAAQIAAIPPQESEIDDAVTAADSTWSSSKITAFVADAKAQVSQSILGAVGADADTLQELLAFINANSDAIANLSASFVKFSGPQTLTTAQKTQAQANIGVADVSRTEALEAYKTELETVDLVTRYETRRIAAGGPVITR